MSDFKEWVLDVTFSTPAFIPFDRETGDLITGVNVMSNKCPGKCVGIVHLEGDKSLEKWIAEHPDWKETYGVEAK